MPSNVRRSILQSPLHVGIATGPLSRLGDGVNRKWIKSTLIGIAIMLVAAFIAAFLLSRGNALPPLPNPNGYDDLLKAAAKLGQLPANCDGTTADELRLILAEAKEGLDLVRVGLSRESRVPVQPSLNYLATHLNEVAGIRSVGYWLIMESRLAALENRPGDALRHCLETIQLGRQTGRGGLIIDVLVAMAVESTGINNLQTNLPSFDARLCRQAATEMEKLESTRQPTEEVIEQERSVMRQIYGIQYIFLRAASWKSISKIEQTVVKKLESIALASRETMLALAARAYELERGQPPLRAADLVPEYLQAVPKDPATGAEMSLKTKPQINTDERR